MLDFFFESSQQMLSSSYTSKKKKRHDSITGHKYIQSLHQLKLSLKGDLHCVSDCVCVPWLAGSRVESYEPSNALLEPLYAIFCWRFDISQCWFVVSQHGVVSKVGAVRMKRIHTQVLAKIHRFVSRNHWAADDVAIAYEHAISYGRRVVSAVL